MANTSSRTLRLLSLLQSHRYWPGAELATRLGVSPRTLRRDVDRLRELGYPVQAHRGVDGGYQLAPGTALPPLVVDDDEAVALAAALQLAAQGGQEAIAEASARALAKVTALMPSRLRRQVEAVAAMTESATWGGAGVEVSPGVLTRAALACRDAERIRFDYTAASGAATRRHVEPHRLVALDRRWYLVAYDLDRQDWRTFRLDRIAVPPGEAAPTPTGARFRPRELPADGDAADFVRRHIATAPATCEVEVIIEAPAAAVRERVGRWGTISPLGPQRSRLLMTPPADSDWPVIALGIIGAEFEIISPPELAERVRDWGTRFTRAVVSPS